MAISRRKKIILTIILLAVLGGGVLIYLFWPQTSEQNKTAQTTTADKENPRQTAITTVVNTADAAIANKKPDQAKQAYNDAVKNASSDEDKGLIKLSETKSFFGNGDLPSALSAGLQSEMYLKDSASLIDVVSTIGGIYESMGDKANAILYYKKTIALINSTKNTYYDQKYYNDKVVGLQKA